MQILHLPNRRLARGFSLVELMVVVVILGLLATVVLFVVADQVDESRLNARQAQVGQLFGAVEQYYTMADGRNLRPALPESLEDLIDGPPDWDGQWRPLIASVPNNPWGHEYEYIIEDAEAGLFTIICYGRNGREGGEGYDADYRRSNMRDR